MKSTESDSSTISNLKNLISELEISRKHLQDNLLSLSKLVEGQQSRPLFDDEDKQTQEEDAEPSIEKDIQKRNLFHRIVVWGRNYLGKISGFEEELIQQKELSANLNLRLDDLQNENNTLQSEYESLANRLQETNNQYQSDVKNLSDQITELDKELDLKKGLVSRFEHERVAFNESLSLLEDSAKHEILVDLIGQITPKRLAFLLENSENRQPDSESEFVMAAKRLVSYLKQQQLVPVNTPGERLKVNVDSISDYQLDEEFAQNTEFEVISPGFRIGEDLLVKPKIQTFMTEGGENDR